METGKEFVSELDERIFGKNTLSTKLFKYFLTMAVLMLALPPVLNMLFEALGIRQIFYFLSLPALVSILLILFVIFSIKKILKPIEALLAEVKKLQRGDFEINLKIGGYVEIDSLVKSVERMRNSLFIASSFLGERDRKKDNILRKDISELHLRLLFLAPFLVYGITLTMLGAVLYSDAVRTMMTSVPMWNILSAVILAAYGIALGSPFGFLLSRIVGRPMRKLAKAAEEASMGNIESDFSVKSTMGCIYELSVRLDDLRKAIKRAMEEMGEEA